MEKWTGNWLNKIYNAEGGGKIYNANSTINLYDSKNVNIHIPLHMVTVLQIISYEDLCIKIFEHDCYSLLPLLDSFFRNVASLESNFI